MFFEAGMVDFTKIAGICFKRSHQAKARINDSQGASPSYYDMISQNAIGDRARMAGTLRCIMMRSYSIRRFDKKTKGVSHHHHQLTEQMMVDRTTTKTLHASACIELQKNTSPYLFYTSYNPHQPRFSSNTVCLIPAPCPRGNVCCAHVHTSPNIMSLFRTCQR